MSCSRPARRARIGVQPHFFGHHAGDERHFDRMPQHVLAVAGAVVQAAEQVDDSLVEAADAGFLDGFFAESLDLRLDLLLRFGDDLLDPRRMDAAVGDELVERDFGDFAADGVERADDHDAGRVVDDDVDAGGLFERADVASFAADDAALHFVAGNIDRAGRGFGGVGGGETLNRREQDFFRLYVGDRGDFLLTLHDQGALLVRQLLIEPLEQSFFRFFRAQAADLMEGLTLGIEQVVQLRLAAVGVFELFSQLALVVLDHLLLFLELVGASLRASPAVCRDGVRVRTFSVGLR